MVLVRNNERRRTGFTLMEVLIVMTIIVIIMSLGGVYAFRSYEDAKKSAAQATAYQIGNALQLYNIKFGSYPDNLNQLSSPPDGHAPFIDGNALSDPWGGSYEFEPSGQHNGGLKPDVWATAKDGTKCGNWKTQQ